MTTATLVFSGIASATISAGILAYYWGDLRRVAAEIDHVRAALARAESQSKTDPSLSEIRMSESTAPAKYPDTERLDWLDSSGCYSWQFDSDCEKFDTRYKHRPLKIRDAIDAARKQVGTTE